MEARELIEYIGKSEKKTPVKIYVKEKGYIDYGNARVFGCTDKVVFGDWEDLRSVVESNIEKIEDIIIENCCRNSALPMLDIKDIPARIEPGAIIREKTEIDNSRLRRMKRGCSQLRLGGFAAAAEIVILTVWFIITEASPLAKTFAVIMPMR